MTDYDAEIKARELTHIRPTDNSVRESDGKQPPQETTPVTLDQSGLPVGFEYGGE